MSHESKPLRDVVDLTDPLKNSTAPMAIEAVRARVRSGDPSRVREIPGHFAVVTRDGKSYPADILVLATGFQAQQMLAPMNIVGRGGRTVRDAWGDDDPRAYLGITAPGFPKLLLLY